MKTVKFSVDMKGKAERMELLVRFIYWIPLALVAWILGMVSGLCTVAQWLYILVTKKRHPTLHKYILMYVDYQAKMGSYLSLLTDERPEIIPEDA